MEWAGVNVKKEPGLTPCQVAEITTSMSPVVKVEVASPTQKNTGETVVTNSVINGMQYINKAVKNRLGLNELHKIVYRTQN